MYWFFALATCLGVFGQSAPETAYSLWSETVERGHEPRGWRPIGNGLVFGFMGPGIWDASLHQITGPHIMLASVMNNGSAFGPASLSVTVAGEGVPWETARLARIRGTGIVVTELRSARVGATVYTYAPFGTKAILRTVRIRNLGRDPLSEVVVHATIRRTVVQEGLLFDSFKGLTDGNAMGQTRRLYSGFLEPFEARPVEERVGTLACRIGDVAPGGTAERTQFIAFDMAEVNDHETTIRSLRRPASQLLAECEKGWKEWLGTKVRLDCPDKKLIDLLEENLISVRMQTADPQKAAGPMEFFAGVWVRDANGPLKYYLRAGDFETAKKMLQFYYRASAYNRVVPNWFPMDIDVTRPIPADLDWDKVPTDRVETPSWLIMQHAWYYDFTGDLGPIREHWNYLKRCLMGQLVDDKGNPFTTINYGYVEPKPNTMYRFPHHGDETWIYPGFEVLNSPVFPEPNDHVHWDEYSADSTWNFVVAAEMMVRFAELLGKKEEAKTFRKIAGDARAACERDYWMPEKGFYAPAMGMVSQDKHQPPFPAVNLNPLWIGYLSPNDPKAISNLLQTMKYTYNPNGVLDATETLKIYVGMLPGMFLYNLAAIHHPLASKALKAMVEVASPSGEYAEKHRTDADSYRSDFLGHRIRPWEGGINMDAALYYLTGLVPDMGRNRISLCPRLPEGWSRMAVTNQRVGKGLLGIAVRDTGTARNYSLSWSGGAPPAVTFTVEIPFARIREVKVGGKARSTKSQVRFGTVTSTFSVPLRAASPTVIEVRYRKETARPIEPKRERYRYVVPKNVPFHDLVLWLQEPRKTSPQDVRAYDILRERVRTRIVTPFVPSTPEWLRPFLIKPDGTINAKLFLMGPRSVTDSLKYTKWWTDPELSRLFQEYMQAGGVIALVKPGETASEWFGPLLSDARYAVLPMQPTTNVASEGMGPAVEALGLLGTKASSMYVYSGFAALASPETEPSAATVLAKTMGQGLFLATLADLDAAALADFATRLTRPQVVSAVRAVAKATDRPSSDAFRDQGNNGVFEDNFSTYKDGSIGLPAWLPISGSWKMEGGKYHQTASHAYDFCSTLNVQLIGDYTIEAVSHLVEGIYEAGFVFNSLSRYNIAQGQMVRFSGQDHIWCGPLQGGFTLQHVLATGITVRDTSPHTLRIDVYNSRGTYDIYVNGQRIAEGLAITVKPEVGKPCYVGLIACRGHVAFTSFSVRPIR